MYNSKCYSMLGVMLLAAAAVVVRGRASPAAGSGGASELKNAGSVAAIEAMVERIFADHAPGVAGGFASPFELRLLGAENVCANDVQPPCFSLADLPGGKVSIAGTTASELRLHWSGHDGLSRQWLESARLLSWRCPKAPRAGTALPKQVQHRRRRWAPHLDC